MAHTAPDRGTRIGLQGGDARVTLLDGTVIPLAGDEHVLILGPGSYRKGGDVTEEDFRPGWQPTVVQDQEERAGSSRLSSHPALETLRNERETGFHRSPDVNPPPFIDTADNRGRGNERPRTWRDHF